MPVDRSSLNLQHSVFFNVFLWSDFPQVRDAADGFVQEILTTSVVPARADRGKLKTHLKVVLMNLYYAHQSDPTLWIGYQRNRNKYSGDSRLERLHLSHKPMMYVIDGLIALGYIENVRGFQDRRAVGRGFNSRMRALPSLIQKLKDGYHVIPAMVQVQPAHEIDELVVLRDSDEKNDLTYIGTALDVPEITTPLRENLKAYNRLLWDTYIDIDMGLSDEWQNIDLSSKQVRAIFNDSSFELGGRLYGGWWQLCKSRNRQCIIINGQNTVELDYKALHPRLMYAMKGLPVPAADPYDVDLLPDPHHPKARDLMKLMFMLFINNTSFAKAVRAYRRKVNKNPDDFPPLMSLPELNALEQSYKALHSPISDMFFTGIGKTLQNIDSKITMDIVNRMTEQSIPILTIHDSYVCTADAVEQIKEQMNRSYVGYFANGEGVVVANVEPEIKHIDYQVRDFGNEEEGDNWGELMDMLEARRLGSSTPQMRRERIWRETGNPNIFLDPLGYRNIP